MPTDIYETYKKYLLSIMGEDSFVDISGYVNKVLEENKQRTFDNRVVVIITIYTTLMWIARIMKKLGIDIIKPINTSK